MTWTDLSILQYEYVYYVRRTNNDKWTKELDRILSEMRHSMSYYDPTSVVFSYVCIEYEFITCLNRN